jgi:hypothetical protein
MLFPVQVQQIRQPVNFCIRILQLQTDILINGFSRHGLDSAHGPVTCSDRVRITVADLFSVGTDLGGMAAQAEERTSHSMNHIDALQVFSSESA